MFATWVVKVITTRRGEQLLQLSYAQGLSQRQIAQQLSVKQYHVSTWLTKAKQLLQGALAIWSKQVLHISPNPDVLGYQ